MKKICAVTDNEHLYRVVKKIIKNQALEIKYEFEFFTSENKRVPKAGWQNEVKAINLKETSDKFLSQYDLFLSLHSRQIFPENIVQEYRCINVHPGYNPYNRGWYPQVFSIINKKPVGVTIHEMDAQLDHGAIIYRESVEISDDDTSGSIYRKIQNKECELLELHLEDLIKGSYQKSMAETEGNINYKDDFENLCIIDMDKTATYREVIDYLRAMTFDDYQNAYFLDKNGNRVYVKLEMGRQTKTNKFSMGGGIFEYAYLIKNCILPPKIVCIHGSCPEVSMGVLS